MAHSFYNWNSLAQDWQNVHDWILQRPKWWQFRKLRKWRSQDPRQYWK